jgi:exonuclease SbcD
MRLLHSSDWHIGRTLYGRKRYDEFAAFLDWMAEVIRRENIDVLLVAGDVFDTSAPSNRSQELYYRFLRSVADSQCRHIVVVAGNHDSPSFLNAPRDVLRYLNIHVIGCISESCSDEVLVLKDTSGEEELIVCAVPYLRDRDIRTAEAGESIADKERKLLDGIRNYYREVCERAEQKRAGLSRPVPIVATGHLFVAGGQTVDGDGVRELYVGSLAHVGADLFPGCIDYLALGHLHVSQKVNGSDTMRYSGSPLPMGFGEAHHEKSVCLVEFSGLVPTVSTISVPRFQKLECIRGNLESIYDRLDRLKSAGESVWVEVVYEGDDVAANLRESLDEAVAGTQIEILRIRNNRIVERALSSEHEDETLDDLSVDDVFARCLDVHEVPEEQRPILLNAYQATITSINEEDSRAE